MVHFAHEFLEFAEEFLGDSVRVGVGFDLCGHISVLLPIVLECTIVLDDHVHDVQVGEDRAQVVEHGVVANLLEALLVLWIAGVEQSIHLKKDVLGQSDDFADGIEELIEYGKGPAELDLHLSSLLLERSSIAFQTAVLSKVDERVKVLCLNLVG